MSCFMMCFRPLSKKKVFKLSGNYAEHVQQKKRPRRTHAEFVDGSLEDPACEEQDSSSAGQKAAAEKSHPLQNMTGFSRSSRTAHAAHLHHTAKVQNQSHQMSTISLRSAASLTQSVKTEEEVDFSYLLFKGNRQTNASGPSRSVPRLSEIKRSSKTRLSRHSGYSSPPELTSFLEADVHRMEAGKLANMEANSNRVEQEDSQLALYNRY